MTFRVMIADSLAPEALAVFNRFTDIDVNNRAGISHEEILAEISDYDALIVRSRTQVSEQIFRVATRLKVVGRAGIGVDNVDVRAATRAGVVVMNTPDGNAVTTAEHTLALIFSMSRRIPQAVAALRAGRWDKKLFVGRELAGKTLGVLGLGNIGRIVAERAGALKMRVIGYDPYFEQEAAAALGVELVSLDNLLEQADIVTVHTPLNEHTRGLIGRREVELMRSGVMLVNCARGGIYDEDALFEGLESGKIESIALDVFSVEPPEAGNPLMQHERVICTPHLGASTAEAQLAVAVAVAEQISEYARGEPARNALNLPRVSAAELKQLAPYLDLGERLGSMAAQLTSGHIRGIEVHLQGALVKLASEPIVSAVLTGVLRQVLDAPVNLVNARFLAKERGMAVTDSRQVHAASGYEATLEVVIDDDKPISVKGALFAGGQGRMVALNDVHLEAFLEGHMLVITNEDKPGVIGRIGTLLGGADINISRMQLGVDEKSGCALSVVNIDGPASTPMLDSLLSAELLNITQVSL